MALIRRSELRELLSEGRGTCVSIYLPTFQAGSDTRQNPIRFRNILDIAEEKLQSRDLLTKELRSQFDRARGLQEDYEFWQHQDAGLSLFLAADVFESYRLPCKVPELTVVGGRFHLKPLLPLFQGNGSFLVLAASINHLRLFYATRDDIHELQSDALPTDLASALGKEYQRQLNYHAQAERTAGGGTAIFHGHGDSDSKADLLEYFQHIDRGLREMYDDRPIPIVFAGVEYLFPIYRQAHHFGHLIDECVAGNPDEWSARQLQERAWPVVESFFRGKQEQVVEAFHENRADNRVTAQVADVLEAAHQGRVATLLIDKDAQQWGTFDPHTGETELHTKQTADNDELLDLAASHTLLHGGAVFALAREEIPGESAMAAILRYVPAPQEAS